MTQSLDPAAFDVRQCLGAGGFGEVYLAKLKGHGEVALKVLHNGLDPRSQAVQRLRDEARLLGLLDHPSILSIHDLVLIDNRVALVTEYIDGQDLEALLVARPGISTPAGLEVLAHVASALQSAFTTIGPRGKPLGLLHRDIKPGNIRVGRDGRVKLLDFGIAKATGITREAKTRTSGVLGSFAYMAPERFDPKQVDTPAGDVCSLGAVLFELLSGGEMLFGDYDIKDLFGLALMRDRREEALQERLNTLSDVPPALVDVLLEMMSYDPADRPALADLPDRLDTLAGEVSGLRLRPWAQQYGWPEAPHLPGGLTGRTLTGSSLGVSTASASLPPTPIDTLGSEPHIAPPDSTGLGSGPTISVDGEPPEPPRPPVAPPPAEPAPSAPVPTPSLTAATITGDDDLPVPATRSGPRWGLIAIAAVIVGLLGLVGGVAGAAGLGLLLAGPSTEDPVGPIDPVPPGPGIADPMPGPQPGGPDPVGPRPPDPVDPGPGTPDPVPGTPEPGVVDPADPEPVDDPALPDPVDPIAPEPVDPGPSVAAGEGIDRCGRLTDLEIQAALGTIAPATQTCLLDAMRDASLKQTDRNKVGRVLLNDAKAVCEVRGDCARYERVQREFFDEVDRSDPNMMAAFTDYLFASANNDPSRLAEVELWANRALERKDRWAGAERKRRLTRLHELRGRAAYQRFTLAPNEKNRRLAFERTAEWAETLRQYNVDAAAAMELCASAAGSQDRCDKRVTTEAATEDIRFLSVPVGAAVSLDGKAVGDTPHTVRLTHGRHTVEMSLEGVTSSYVIQVGGGEATQWQWRKSQDAWQAVYD